jgi:parallel beta-helix repeat protein
MYNEASTATVTNCMFSGNSANTGGGMRNLDSNPTVTNCTFSGNSANTGGGMSASGSFASPTVTNCVFSGNTATQDGGGMYNRDGSEPTITNCTFSENTATSGGGGIYNRDLVATEVVNTILWGNTPEEVVNVASVSFFGFCNIQGGFLSIGGAANLGGNIDADPLFVDPDGADDILGTPDDDLRLQPGSPCIDAGDNTALALAGPPPITTDLGGAPRFFDDTGVPDTGAGLAPIIDMGAHEFQGVSPPPCPCVGDIDGDCDTDVFDFSALAANFGSGPGASRAQGDLTGDGFVDVFDFSELAANFGCAP